MHTAVRHRYTADTVGTNLPSIQLGVLIQRNQIWSLGLINNTVHACLQLPTWFYCLSIQPGIKSPSGLPSMSIWNWNPFILKISRFSMTTVSPTAVSSSGSGLEEHIWLGSLWNHQHTVWLAPLTAEASGVEVPSLSADAQNCTFHPRRAVCIQEQLVHGLKLTKHFFFAYVRK